MISRQYDVAARASRPGFCDQDKAAMQRVAAIVLCGLFGLVGSRASAQSFDLAGTRAKGMAGAFVAVADDGRRRGGIRRDSNTLIFDGVADFRQDGFTDGQHTPIVNRDASGSRTRKLARPSVVPPLGFSDYRIRQTAPSGYSQSVPRRKDPAKAHARAVALTQQFGVMWRSRSATTLSSAPRSRSSTAVGTAVAAFDDPDPVRRGCGRRRPAATKGDVDRRRTGAGPGGATGICGRAT